MALNTRASLDRSPRANWVERAGGLPMFIRRIANHLHAKGMPISRAVPVAVNAAKRMCASGDVNWPGLQQVNAKSRAEACKAVAEWEAKKARTTSLSNSCEGCMNRVDLARPPLSAEARKRAQAAGNTFEGSRFPINSRDQLARAIRALGRAKPEDRARIRAYIARRARALGAADMLPDSWKTKGGGRA